MFKKLAAVVSLLVFVSGCGTTPPTQAELRAQYGDVKEFIPDSSQVQWMGCGLWELTDFENGFCTGQQLVFAYVRLIEDGTTSWDGYKIDSYFSKNMKFNSSTNSKICNATLIPKAWEDATSSAEFVVPVNKSEFLKGCQLGIERTYPAELEDYRMRHAPDPSVPNCQSSNSSVSCDDEYLANVENRGGYYASLGDQSSELNMATKFCNFLDDGTSVEEWMQMGVSAKPGDEDWVLFLSAIAAAALISYCPEYQSQALPAN
jgi:hypothetical protein